MKKLIYVEENFIDSSLCERFIEFAKANKSKEVPYGNYDRGGDTFITNIVHEENYGGNLYQGGIPDCIDLNLTDQEIFEVVLNSITQVCKSFDENIRLDYPTVIRWPVGTFMKPHYDNSYQDNPDVFAALVYLNDNYDGGHTCFEEFEIKPKTGKLVIFSNSQYLHHVSKVEGGERFVLSLWFSGLTGTRQGAILDQ